MQTKPGEGKDGVMRAQAHISIRRLATILHTYITNRCFAVVLPPFPVLVIDYLAVILLLGWEFWERTLLLFCPQIRNDVCNCADALLLR